MAVCHSETLALGRSLSFPTYAAQETGNAEGQRHANRKLRQVPEKCDPTMKEVHGSNAKIRFQSFFMLTTFQPFVAAAFNDALSGSA